MADQVIFSPGLADAFNQVGLPYPGEHTPGGTVRFSTDGRVHDKAGWLRVFPDGNGACFGDWREGASYCWQRRDENAPKPTSGEIKQAKEQARKAREQAEAEREAMYAKKADELKAVFDKLPQASSDNDYLSRKGINPIGDVRQGANGQLVVPALNGDGNLQSLQQIYPDGKKRFAPSARMAGGRFILGEIKDGDPIVLAEGYATAASIFMTGIGAVAVGFFGHNLKAVAADLRQRYPASFILIAGDLDDGGQGERYAKEAMAGAMPLSVMVLPTFNDDRTKGDFNDLHQAEGLDEVENQLKRALIDLNNRADTKPSKQFDVPALPSCDARDGTKITRPLTEMGNALRLHDSYGENLRYVYETGKWLIWHEGAWRWDSSGFGIRSLAASLPKKIYQEGANFGVKEADHFLKHARFSQKEIAVNSAINLLKSTSGTSLSASALDQDLMLIGFDFCSKVIDLRTGKVRHARRDDYVTKSLRPSDVGDASKAVRWLQFLDQIFLGDAELIGWIKRFLGYTLTGETSEQIFLFLFGLGANGKGVFTEAIRHIMGDYSRMIEPETLAETKRQAGQASPDVAALVGARVGISTETPEGSMLNENFIKALVGGDRLTARRLYEQPFDFTPQIKLIMSGNHRPIVRGTDHGIWRRVRLVPFNKTFSDSDRDPNLLAKLKAESQHILAWMVQGCLEWQERGLSDTPTVIAEQTQGYRDEQDIIGTWLSECTETSPLHETSMTNLYACYKAWAEANGLKPMSNIILGRRLSERGFVSGRNYSGRFWGGIRVTSNMHYDGNNAPY